MLPTIVIIGRRNVGKSALFNRLIEQSKAIVSEIPGTTRDRTEGICTWRGERMRIVDTGGLDVGDENTIDREVKKQARFAIKEADVIVFLTDARVGPQPADQALAKELRQLQSNVGRGLVPRRGQGQALALQLEHLTVILVANKAETAKWREAAAAPQWKRLGFGLPHTISALTGQGVGDLLDVIFSQLQLQSVGRGLVPRRGQGQAPALQSVKPDLHIAIIGKPNVGKSSLLNKLLGEERVIVSPIPHTTREPQDTLFTYHPPFSPPYVRGGAGGLHILLVDTAGIRKKAKIARGIEQIGVGKTLAVIERSDVVIFVLDATQPLDVQDKHLAQMIEEKGVGVIIAANKWDMLQETENRKQETSPPLKIRGGRGSYEQSQSKAHDLLLKQIHFGLPGLTFAPVVFISALTGHGAHKLIPLALEAQKNRNHTIPNEELKEILPKLILRHRPARATDGTRHPIIRRIEQTATEPPTFVIIIGPKQSLHQTYLRYLENRLREFYNFEGTPIKVWVKQDR